MRRGGRWREDIWDRVLRLADDSATAPGTPAGKHLQQAAAYANAPWTQWWWDPGSQVEACWRELHLAEESLLRATQQPLLQARAADVARRGARVLGRDDGQVARMRALADQSAEQVDVDVLRESAVNLLTRIHQASDQQMRNLRSLRNQLRFLAGLLALLAVATVVAIGILGWQILPAPDGIPAWGALAVAMVAGLLGALFSAVPSLAAVPEKSMVFNPIREQALLKLAVGAWSAVFGLVAVSAGLGKADASPASLAGFLMVAALFGAAQEALTRFADRKATVVRDTPKATPTPGQAASS